MPRIDISIRRLKAPDLFSLQTDLGIFTDVDVPPRLVDAHPGK